MRWLVLITGISLVVGGLYLRWAEPYAGPLRVVADSATLRDTANGPVIGGFSPQGAQVWLGIPYASPPVGARRWRAPGPVPGWLAPRETLRFSDVCPQFASRLSASTAEPGTLVGREDCLYLNVFAPAGTSDRARLPVMVFIPGGGNTIGSATPYDASLLAQEQGVVVVTLAYRLGVLGWFSHRALRGAQASPEDASGNFGLLDVIAALRWVRTNVRAFGGDPQRVTVFGESAGARNIYALLASPLARDLVHGAIIQSGFPGTYPVSVAENAAEDVTPGHPNSSHELVNAWLTRGRPQARTETAAAQQRLPDVQLLAFLRGLSVQEIFEPIVRDSPMYSTPTLFRDGHVLPERPLTAVFREPGAWSRVPVLAGTNRDEMKLFLALSERHTRERFGLIPKPRDPARYDALARHHSASWKATGVDMPLSLMHAGDAAAARFAYRFDWDNTLRNLFVDLPQLLGAAHAMELDFLFQPLVARIAPGVEHTGNRAERRRLGRAMRDYWAGFAYNGMPGSGRSGTQVPWPRWTPESPRVMLLDGAEDGGVRSETLALSVTAVKQALGADDGLPERLRCALYVDLYLFNNGLPELFDAREYQAMGCGQFPARSLRGLSR